MQWLFPVLIMTPEQFKRLRELEQKYLDLIEEIEDHGEYGLSDEYDLEDWCPEHWK